MKIAIVHEMLIKLGGAEKVVENLLEIFPEAELFTLIYDEKKVGKVFPKKTINNQCFNLGTQKIYNIFKNQRFCLPYMNKSIEALDFSDFDVVISSSSGFAHGCITKPETKFIVYYHSPARYMWDWTNEYKKDIGWNKGIKGFFLNKLFLNLRQWDFIASQRVDINLANSENVAKRIEKYYRKDSILVYPPVETNRFAKEIIFNENEFSDYYIIISALTEFKKIEVAIEAFNKMPDKKLIIIGDGNYREFLENLANKDGYHEKENKNIKFVGAKYGDDLVSLVQNSKGLIFPGEEDFGIVPLEAMAAGKPVFAYYGGGLKETNLAGITGEFFKDKNGSDFIENFEIFDTKIKNKDFSEEEIKKHASKFDKKVFEEKIKEIVFNNK